MFFSKSFIYALRSTLYLAGEQDSRPVIRLDEIAAALDIPRHFLGKILKRLAKEGILVSAKGPSGGFGATPATAATPLLTLIELTGQSEKTDICSLLTGKCDPLVPCPLHHRIAAIKKEWLGMLSGTTIASLLHEEEQHSGSKKLSVNNAALTTVIGYPLNAS